VSCYCSLEDAGETSLKVKIETWARGRGRDKAPEKVTEGVFTFVAIGEDHRPRKISAGGAEQAGRGG
jgi:acyl-CoA thioesterase YciA